MRATAAAIRAVDQVMAGAADNAFCAVRPPGHHAEPSRAMGFCLFNTVAVAALHARAAHGAKRVAVVDFDVHHGNGTQAAFWSDKDLFYGSTHQMPLFPRHRRLERDGRSATSSTRRSSPGDDGEDFREAWEARIFPALDASPLTFSSSRPASTPTSADPLAQPVSEADFAWVTEKLSLLEAVKHTSRRNARFHAGGRLRSRCAGVVHRRPCRDADGGGLLRQYLLRQRLLIGSAGKG